MRYLARYAKLATLSPVKLGYGVLHHQNLCLEIDGKVGVVRINQGSVDLLWGDTVTRVGLPRGGKGNKAAKQIHDEIVHRERLVAEREARRLAAEAAERGKLDAAKADLEARQAAACELQARFDGLLAERGLPAQCGVRFYVRGSNREGEVPSYPQHEATVLTDLRVTPERAGPLLDLLIAGGFIRPLTRKRP